jgi:hypothetical protein
VEVLLLPPEALLPAEVPLLKHPRRKRRQKRRFVLFPAILWIFGLMIPLQEESDDDMGFGLFD